MIWSDPRAGSGFDSDSDLSLKKGNRKLPMVSGIAVVMPTNEHGNTAPHDVKSSPLFLHQFCTFSCKRTSPFRRISHQRTRGGRRSASRRSLLLGQLPFLLHVKRRRNGGGSRWGNRSHFSVKCEVGLRKGLSFAKMEGCRGRIRAVWRKKVDLFSWRRGCSGIYKGKGPQNRLKEGGAWQWVSHLVFFPFPNQRYAIIIFFDYNISSSLKSKDPN